MRIAISTDTADGLQAPVSSHFGRCPYYVIVEVQDGGIGATRSVANPHYPDHAPGVIPQFIHGQGVQVMITGGMGRRAMMLFDQLGVQPVTGAMGTAREAVEAFLQGRLSGSDPCRDSAHGCGDRH